MSVNLYICTGAKEVSGKCGTTDHRLQCGSVMVMVTELVAWDVLAVSTPGMLLFGS